MDIKTALLLILLKNVLSANILYIAPLASPSHHLWNKIISLALIEKGHNITMLSHDAEKEPPPKNFTVITMEGAYEALEQDYEIQDIGQANILKSILFLYDAYLTLMCVHDLQTNGLQTLLDYPEDYKFDLIIFDVTFGQCLYPLIDRFHKPPVIGVTAFLLPPVLGRAFGNHLYTSYMPFYSTPFTNHMNLMERILNFIYTYFEIFYNAYIAIPKQFEFAKRKFGENIRPLEEIERNISILLANINPILDYPISLPPNIIPVGGMHVKPAKPLPKDLQRIVEGAKDGVILLSLGTNIRSDKLRENQRKALLNAFAKLPQIVLWKFESENLEGCPKNVIIRKWLPQNDILGHPNTRLFISHGGGLSTQEAVYHGVPVVGMPFFIDQNVNVRKMVQRGLAKFLDPTKLTSKIVYETIKEVLDNTTYIQNMNELSKLYRDQPQQPLEKAIFWIEYVLRHGGAEHLVTPARDMPLYQISNLDVIAIFGFASVLLYFFVSFAITACLFVATSIKPREIKKETK